MSTPVNPAANMDRVHIAALKLHLAHSQQRDLRDSQSERAWEDAEHRVSTLDRLLRVELKHAGIDDELLDLLLRVLS